MCMRMRAFGLTNSGMCGGQKLTLVCFPQSTLKQLLTEPGVCTSARLAGQHVPGTTCFQFPASPGVLGEGVGAAMHGFFMWMLGIWVQSLTFPSYKSNFYSPNVIVFSEAYCWIKLALSSSSWTLAGRANRAVLAHTLLQADWFSLASLSFSLNCSAWPKLTLEICSHLLACSYSLASVASAGLHLSSQISQMNSAPQTWLPANSPNASPLNWALYTALN